MKIALIGAPGSGKSELAKALTEKLDGDVKVVDDYIVNVEEYSRFVIDSDATYIGNLYALLGRYAEERRAQEAEPDHVISCGTLIETAIYTSLEAVQHQDDPHWVRVQNMMNIIGSFFQDTWRYDLAFVLDLPNADIETHPGKLNKHLFMAINSFGIHYTPLGGPLQDRVDKVMEAVEQAKVNEEDEAETADQL